ncbi:hypothetical protein ACFSR6_03275 [Pedobacter vanadiisoli]|uniref:DUF4235 domain-containing protein n=1 Tax=Pedobacter vanadiisoli TaxID=1761975 RepID=A0ABW5ME52_9SPHI
MIKTSIQMAAGTLGFAGMAEIAQDSIHQTANLIAQNAPPLGDPNTYVKGLIVSGIIQIAMKLIDRWAEKRKAKKEVKEAELVSKT